jgi:alanyl-tRNA synthetase
VLHHGCKGVVLSPTPFYAESDGQIGEPALSMEGRPRDGPRPQKPVGSLSCRVRVDRSHLARGARSNVRAAPTRLDTTANHTATHLLHKALKDILGETVQQAGSLVAPDRLRFDYTWHQPLTDDQIKAIEALVNDKIRENAEVTKTVMPIAEAKKSGAVAMFGEKYGDRVRIVAPATGRAILRRLPRQPHRRYRHLQDRVRSLVGRGRPPHGGAHRPRRACAFPESR